MFIRRLYATPRAARYATLLRELDSGKGLDAKSFQLSEMEKSDAASRLHGDLYLSTKVCKYVLLRLDELVSENPGVIHDHPRITIEHVLPQSPPSSSRWRIDFSDEQRKQWTHRLGNLVLLNRNKNARAQNFDFERKKTEYFLRNGVATFALTVQLIANSEWTPRLLEQRHDRLMQILRMEWQL
jgi:hypothetical protein